MVCPFSCLKPSFGLTTKCILWDGVISTMPNPKWRNRPLYLCLPETGLASYTPGNWMLILVASNDMHVLRWSYSYHGHHAGAPS